MSDYDPRFQSNRSYKCPCGKAYLSASALYTHIKFKHQGHVITHLFRLLANYNIHKENHIEAVDVETGGANLEAALLHLQKL